MNTLNQILSVIGCAAAFLAFFLLLFFIVKKKKRSQNTEYDERQIVARGKAFRAGFFAMMLYFAWYMVVSTFEFELISMYNVPIIFAGIIFGTGVFAVIAIKNDAYLKLHEKRSSHLTVLILVTIVNAVSGIGNFINDAKSGIFLMNALCAVLGIVILAAILLHQKNELGNAEDAE